jgi:hypothetical protein
MCKESREVPHNNERQEHKQNGNCHEREPTPRLLVTAKENSSKNWEQQNHLELRQQGESKKHRGVLEKPTEINAVQSGDAKDAREHVHLSPNWAIEQKCRIQSHKRKRQMSRKLRQLETSDQAARQIDKSDMAKVHWPQAEELEEGTLFYGDIRQIMDLRHYPQPKDIKRRIIAIKTFKTISRKLLYPIDPIILVATKGGRISAEQVGKQANDAPNQKILDSFIFHQELRIV